MSVVLYLIFVHRSSIHLLSLFKKIRILVGTQAKILMALVLKENTTIGMTFHHHLTLFARAKGFLRRKHLMEILMMKMVNYAIWKNLEGLKLHQIL